MLCCCVVLVPPGHRFDATPEQLASFLASLLAAGKVTLLAGNVYGAAVAKGAHASSENRRQ